MISILREPQTVYNTPLRTSAGSGADAGLAGAGAWTGTGAGAGRAGKLSGSSSSSLSMSAQRIFGASGFMTGADTTGTWTRQLETY